MLRDPQAMVVSLEAGTLDLVLNPPMNDFIRLQKSGNIRRCPMPLSGSYYALVPNTTVAPLDNKQVRQALNYAIDRQRILDQVLQGIGRTENLPWAPSSPAYEPDKNTRYAFDLDKARSLLGSRWRDQRHSSTSCIRPPFPHSAQSRRSSRVTSPRSV